MLKYLGGFPLLGMWSLPRSGIRNLVFFVVYKFNQFLISFYAPVARVTEGGQTKTQKPSKDVQPNMSYLFIISNFLLILQIYFAL